MSDLFAKDMGRKRNGAWEREAIEEFQKSRATEIGAAGEHIVCADLILKGHRAFLAAQGLPYDVIADIRGVLVRIAVKSTTKLAQRPKRESNRICYQFAVVRSQRLNTGKKITNHYTSADADIVAFCALDILRVAYSHISECGMTVTIDPTGSSPVRGRKTFESLSISRALGIHSGQICPFQVRGRDVRPSRETSRLL